MYEHTRKLTGKKRASGRIVRPVYIELDEELYEALRAEKEQTRTTYSTIIRKALAAHFSSGKN